MHILRRSDVVGSGASFSLARLCHFKYCPCRRSAISRAGTNAPSAGVGSIQHSFLAHGFGLMTSGGSTVTLRHITRTPYMVPMRSLTRHGAHVGSKRLRFSRGELSAELGTECGVAGRLAGLAGAFSDAPDARRPPVGKIKLPDTPDGAPELRSMETRGRPAFVADG